MFYTNFIFFIFFSPLIINTYILSLFSSRRERTDGNNENRNIFIADNWRKRKKEKKFISSLYCLILFAVVDNGQNNKN